MGLDFSYASFDKGVFRREKKKERESTCAAVVVGTAVGLKLTYRGHFSEVASSGDLTQVPTTTVCKSTFSSEIGLQTNFLRGPQYLE